MSFLELKFKPKNKKDFFWLYHNVGTVLIGVVRVGTIVLFLIVKIKLSTFHH